MILLRSKLTAEMATNVFHETKGKMGHLTAIGSTEWGNRQSRERLSDRQAHRSTCISTAHEAERSPEAHTYGEVQVRKRAEGADTDRFIKTDADVEAVRVGVGWGAPESIKVHIATYSKGCLLYTSPSPRDASKSRMPSSA